MKQPPPTDSLGARNHWRRVLWVILIVVLVLLARRMAGGADAWQTADQLLSSGNAREATVAYEKLIRQKPDDARGYLGRGRSRWRLNQLDGAIADFSKVIELDPKSSVAYNNRGLAYHDQGKHGQALADYSKRPTILALRCFMSAPCLRCFFRGIMQKLRRGVAMKGSSARACADRICSLD